VYLERWFGRRVERLGGGSRGSQRAVHRLDSPESNVPVAVETPQDRLILGEHSLCIREDSQVG